MKNRILDINGTELTVRHALLWHALSKENQEFFRTAVLKHGTEETQNIAEKHFPTSDFPFPKTLQKRVKMIIEVAEHLNNLEMNEPDICNLCGLDKRNGGCVSLYVDMSEMYERGCH